MHINDGDGTVHEQEGRHPIQGITRFTTGSHSHAHTLTGSNPEFYTWIPEREGHWTLDILQPPAHGPRDLRPATCDLQAATLNLPVFACTRSFMLILHRAGGQWSDDEMRWQAGCVQPVARWCKGGAERERVARRVSGTWRSDIVADRGRYWVLRARRRGYACSV